MGLIERRRYDARKAPIRVDEPQRNRRYPRTGGIGAERRCDRHVVAGPLTLLDEMRQIRDVATRWIAFIGVGQQFAGGVRPSDCDNQRRTALQVAQGLAGGIGAWLSAGVD